ncbi:MAG: 23S rRNA (uracil(1939)-C(5))-methyltransferase RlmD [Erysipelotrichaceae bacterium]
MQVKIMKMGINGEGIGYIDSKPVFVPGAISEELVNIQDVKKMNTYCTASLQSVIKKSKSRVTPKCAMQPRCGGCNMMHMTMKKQLEVKQDTMRQTMIKYAGLKDVSILPIIKSEDYYYYRNQFKFPVKTLQGKLVSGMFQPESHHLVYLNHCMIHEKELEKLRIAIMDVLNTHKVKDYYERIQSGLRYIICRGFEGKYQLTLVTGENSMSNGCIEALSKIEGIQSIYQNINTDDRRITSDDYRLLYGSKTIELRFKELVFRLSPASFFQLNFKQALNLYDYAVGLIEPCDVVVEAYSGIGAMSLMAASKAQEVYGVEIVGAAVKNANSNAKFNHMDDYVRFVCSDAGKYLSTFEKDIDYLLIDPPRKGIDDKMIDAIYAKQPKNIIYVSCNPSTLAKNIYELEELYEVVSMQPFDMFPNTSNIECVTKLTLRK